jgi:hypothetical protein
MDAAAKRTRRRGTFEEAEVAVHGRPHGSLLICIHERARTARPAVVRNAIISRGERGGRGAIYRRGGRDGKDSEGSTFVPLLLSSEGQ